MHTLAAALLLLLPAPLRAGPAPEPPPAPYQVRVEDAWIPMSDGVRLAANVFMPDGAAPGERFPVILMYLPYRHTAPVPEGSRPVSEEEDDSPTAYFVRHGYVGVHVDIRGTGRSEGRTPDREYSEQEQLDGLDVIAWLARQPWSDGHVGMWGISWGGFNSIQLAARRPPALKAIIAIQATEDLFQDDIHYIDGQMHIDQFELSMDLNLALPPAPDYPVDEAMLAARFDTPPWSLLYLRHQRDGPFWRRASLDPPYDEIQIPSFFIGGWFDGYRDSIPRMMQHMTAPTKGLVGPWNHTLPHDAVPGPRIEWRREAVRWWDHWLKGKDTGIMDEPALALYIRHWHPPDPDLLEIPGEWRTEDGWPPRRLREETLRLRHDGTLDATSSEPATHRLRYVPTAGVAAGFWWGEVPPDQRPVDAFSLVYESAPLDEDLEILGLPRALLHASADAPLAHWFARLSNVAPDGTVTLVTGAGLNGAHRESAADPRPLVPGTVYPLEIEMHFTSWVFPRGHRIRLAVSNALWPMIWPTPHAMATTLHLGGEHDSRLVLPVMPLADRPRPDFTPIPMGTPGRGGTWPGEWRTERDDLRRTTTITWQGSTSSQRPWGRSVSRERLVYVARDDRPADSSIHGEAEHDVHLADRVLSWRGRLRVSSDATTFFYRYTRELYRDGLLVRTRTWEDTVPRDHQ